MGRESPSDDSHLSPHFCYFILMARNKCWLLLLIVIVVIVRHRKWDDFHCIWVMLLSPHGDLNKLDTLANKLFHNIFHKVHRIRCNHPSPISWTLQHPGIFWWHRRTGKLQSCRCQQTDLWWDISPFPSLFHLLCLPCLLRRWWCDPPVTYMSSSPGYMTWEDTQLLPLTSSGLVWHLTW